MPPIMTSAATAQRRNRGWTGEIAQMAMQGIDRIADKGGIALGLASRQQLLCTPREAFLPFSYGIREFLPQSIKTIEAEALSKPC